MKEKIMEFTSKITVKQKIISLVVAIVLLVGSFGGYFVYQNLGRGEAQATLDMASLYQDEIVEISDIVVGTSETGTASLVYEEISLDAGYEVTETLVEVGVHVEEGDIIATIDLEASEVDDSEELEEIEDAEAALEQLTIETEARLIDAKSTYDLAVANGENAQTIYNLEIAEINDGLTDLDDAIEELEEKIEDLEYQLANGLSDDYGISSLNEELIEINAEIEEAEAEVAAEEAAAANSVSTSTEAGNNSTSSSTSTSSSSQSELEQLEAEKASIEASIEAATEQYETAYDELPDQIEQYEDELSSKETERTRYAASMDGLKVAAKSTYDSNINTYSNAYATYSLTVSELNSALEEAEELVEDLIYAYENGEEEDDAIIIDVDGNLLAPCSGYITTVSEPSSITMDGNTIESGLSITMSDDQYAELEISVAQDDIADISIGMVANVVFDSYEDELIISEVDTLSLTPSGDMTSSVNYTVTVLCEIPEGMTIFSSMTATVTFVEAQSNDVLAISVNYVIYEDGQQYVYLESADGSVELVEIETGFSDGFDVEIISGLEEGDIVLNESAVIGIEN